MHVKPAPEKNIPDPDKGGFLTPEGREVEASAYWLRRLVEGDVVEVKFVKPTKEKHDARQL